MSRYRPETAITTLLIHCSDTPNGQYFDAKDIDDWHGPSRIKQGKKPFRRDPKLIGFHRPDLEHIGYQFVGRTTGAIEAGRKLTETGAHCKEDNYHTIGTCLIGRDKFTLEQWGALKRHVESFKRQFPNLKIKGHREYNPNKTCPGFDVQAWLAGDMEPLEGHILEG